MTTETQTIRSANPLTMILTSGAFIFVLRIFLGALFIYSAINKVGDPRGFGVAVRLYEIIPVPLSNLFALSVAWGELVAGVLLVFGVQTRKAAAAILWLILSFVIAITITIVRGLTVDCGCFGNEGGHSTGYGLIIRNLFLMVTAIMVIRFDRGTLSLGTLIGRKS